MLLVTLARFRHVLSVGVLLAAAACSGSDDGTGHTSSAITLDGVYQGQANGTYAWSSFHDGHYALWSGATACAAAGADEATCSESGTFTTDTDGKTVTLTPDGAGAVHELRIDVLASAPLVGTRSIAPKVVGLVGSGSQLVNQGSSDDSLVANQFSAQDNGGPIVHQVDLRTTTFALLQYCSILMGNPADKKIEVSPPPAQITSSCSGGKK